MTHARYCLRKWHHGVMQSNLHWKRLDLPMGSRGSKTHTLRHRVHVAKNELPTLSNSERQSEIRTKREYHNYKTSSENLRDPKSVMAESP